MTYARRALAGLATLVLLGASGCIGDDPDPDVRTSPPSPPTPTVSPTPTLAAPTIPPAAQEHSAAGAAAFVRYWIALVNEAAITGATDTMRAGATPTCSACSALAKRYETIYAKGGSSESPGWQPTVTSSQLIEGDFYVTVDLTTASHIYRPSADVGTRAVKGRKYHDLYRLRWIDGGWKVDKLAPQETSK